MNTGDDGWALLGTKKVKGRLGAGLQDEEGEYGIMDNMYVMENGKMERRGDGRG